MNSFVSHLPAILQNAITMNDLEQMFLRSSITISLTPCSEKIKQKNEIEKNNNFVTCVSIPLAHAGNTAFETRRNDQRKDSVYDDFTTFRHNRKSPPEKSAENWNKHTDAHQYCRTTSFQKLVTIYVKKRFKKSGQRLTFCVLSRSEKLFYECKWCPLFFCNQNKSSLFHACYSAGKVNNPSLLICPYTTY